MKKSSVFFVLILSFFLALNSACSRAQKSEPIGTVKVKIPWFEGQRYQLNTVQIESLTDLNLLKGSAVRFVIFPSVHNKKIIGNEPKVSFVRTDQGILVPQNFLSAQLFTLYAHFENLNKLDRELGIDKLLHQWPRQQLVAVEARVFTSKEKIINNAMYSLELGAFLFVPYHLEELPIALNSGIIGHEYFHALFHQHFHQRLELERHFQDDKLKYYQVLTRALNEGLADVWGWLYSQDLEFVSRSHSTHKERSLNRPAQRLLEAQEIQVRIQFEAGESEVAYEVGSVLAKSIWQLSQQQQSSRKKIASAIFQTVDAYRDLLQTRDMEKLLAPEDLFKIFKEKIQQGDSL